METLVIDLDKDVLFDRCHTDVAVRGRQSEPPMQMCEHDRSWFEVALVEASNIVLEELARIAKDVATPMSNTQTKISFSVRPTNARQETLLPYAVERAVIDHIVNMWYGERAMGSMVEGSIALLKLKYVTLINSGASRKANF